jgi:hypothetical protein
MKKTIILLITLSVFSCEPYLNNVIKKELRGKWRLKSKWKENSDNMLIGYLFLDSDTNYVEYEFFKKEKFDYITFSNNQLTIQNRNYSVYGKGDSLTLASSKNNSIDAVIDEISDAKLIFHCPDTLSNTSIYLKFDKK